jgi:hypothetical protein
MKNLEKLLEVSGWKSREKDDGDVLYTHPFTGAEYRFPFAASLLLYSIRVLQPPSEIRTICKNAFQEALDFLEEHGWELDGHMAHDSEHSSRYAYEMEEAFLIQVHRIQYVKLLEDTQDGEDPTGLN